MGPLENLGQILVLLINYADSEDIFQLIKFCYPYIKREPFTEDGPTIKEFLLEKLCEPQYKIFESVYKKDLKKVDKYLKTSRLEILILHLYILQKCYFNNFLFVTSDEIKKEEKEEIKDIRIGSIADALKDKSCNKKGFIRILTKGNIKKTDIPIILHILIDNYRKYNFYYLFNGEKIIKVEITYKKGTADYESTVYELELLARKTNFINLNTNNKIQVDKKIQHFFTNKYNQSDILYVSLNDFKKINSTICKGLAKDIPTKTCAWCNPNKNKQKQHKLCDNCNFLLEKLRVLQYHELIEKFNIHEEIKKYGWKDYKTLKGLRQKRKEHLIELLGYFYGLNSKDTIELTELIEKSFRDID